MKNVLVVVNQKGGVGKTTTVLNLAAALSEHQRKKILVIDIDPQANATTGVGIEKNQLKSSVYDVLINQQDITSAIIDLKNEKFKLLPANRNLAGAEIELVNIANREFCLTKALAPIKDDYDLILIDCPPSLSLLTLNALVAADYLIVPIQCEYYALEGLTDLLNTVNLLQKKLNPNLQLLGILRTMYDRRNNLAQQVATQLVDYFAQKVFNVTIPRAVRLAEAPSFGLTVVSLEPDSISAMAYIRLAKEIVKRLK